MKKLLLTITFTALTYTCALFWAQMTGKLNISLNATQYEQVAEIDQYEGASAFDMPLEEVRRRGR